MYNGLDEETERNLARLDHIQNLLETGHLNNRFAYSTDYLPEISEITGYSEYPRTHSAVHHEQSLTPPETPYCEIISRQSDFHETMWGESDEESSSEHKETEKMNGLAQPTDVHTVMREGRTTRSMTELQQQQQQHHLHPMHHHPQDSPSYPVHYQHDQQWDQYGNANPYCNAAVAQQIGGDDTMSGGDDDEEAYNPQGFSQPAQPPATPAPSQPVEPAPMKLSPRSRATSSSQRSETGSEKKRKKYTLKKDHQREDPKYKDHRRKNNESVKRTREKKEREAAEKEEKRKKEVIDLRNIVKMFMDHVGEEESAIVVENMSPSERALVKDIEKLSRSPQPGTSRRH